MKTRKEKETFLIVLGGLNQEIVKTMSDDKLNELYDKAVTTMNKEFSK